MSDAAPKAAVSKGAAETAQSLRLLRSLTNGGRKNDCIMTKKIISPSMIGIP
jgi:hypothetical protein